MLENTPPPPPPDSSATAAVKRYVHPHRKSSLSRRKSGERIDTGNNVYGNEVVGGVVMSENSYPPRRLISLEGSSRGPASHLLTNRWEAMMRIYNDVSIDLSERPIMYAGSNASAWGHFKLPHQIMSPVNNVGPSTGSQMDFLSELHRAIQNANVSSNN